MCIQSAANRPVWATTLSVVMSRSHVSEAVRLIRIPSIMLSPMKLHFLMILEVFFDSVMHSVDDCVVDSSQFHQIRDGGTKSKGINRPVSFEVRFCKVNMPLKLKLLLTDMILEELVTFKELGDQSEVVSVGFIRHNPTTGHKLYVFRIQQPKK